MAKFIKTPLSKDLPENWDDTKYVSPNGTEVGLTEKHGYNYLMKQVNNSHKGLEELDNFSSYSHRNLLHNWYFKDPVDRKMGYICFPNVPYYSTSELTAQSGTTSTYLKATYVSPAYSSIVIGSTPYYVHTASIIRGYVSSGRMCVDRWRLSGDRTSLRISSDGIILGLNGTQGIFAQSVGPANAMHYIHRTFTLSVEVVSLSGGNPSLFISYGEDTMEAQITGLGIVTLTGTMPEESTDFEVGIVNRSGQDSVIQIASVKLEAGPFSTLAEEVLPSYAEQMAICAQFDPSTGSYVGFPNAVTSNVLADATITE